MNIFERTRKKREAEAETGTKQPKPAQKQGGMSQADFSYGPEKKEQRPPMSKKWTEK